MLFRFELLYFVILLQHFSLGERLNQENYTARFKATVTGSSGTTECDFTLKFTDVEVLKSSKVKCGKIKKKTMIINSFNYEIESSMHSFRKAIIDFVFFFNLLNFEYFLKSLQSLTNFLKVLLMLIQPLPFHYLIISILIVTQTLSTVPLMSLKTLNPLK